MRNSKILTDRQRNYSLDTLKGIAALFVIFMHAKFPGTFGEIINTIAEFAVPIFFLTSGYFIFGANSKKISKNLLHIIKLTIVAYVLNLIRLMISSNFSLKAFTSEILGLVSLKKLILFFVFNVTNISGVAWFLWALIYCYFAYFVATKIFEKTGKNLLVLCYIYIAVGFVLGIAITFSHLPIPIRSFIITGFPFFMIGNLFKKFESEGKRITPNIMISIMFIVLGFALLIFENFVLDNNVFIGKIITGYGLFTLVVCKPTAKIQPFFTIGQKYLFPIYIGHPLVMHFVEYIAKKMQVEKSEVYLWVYPIIVMLVTILISIFVMYMIDIIKNKKSNN